MPNNFIFSTLYLVLVFRIALQLFASNSDRNTLWELNSMSSTISFWRVVHHLCMRYQEAALLYRKCALLVNLHNHPSLSTFPAHWIQLSIEILHEEETIYEHNIYMHTEIGKGQNVTKTYLYSDHGRDILEYPWLLTRSIQEGKSNL